MLWKTYKKRKEERRKIADHYLYFRKEWNLASKVCLNIPLKKVSIQKR